MMKMKKVEGTINAWFAERGYGFILANPEGTYVKYFLHVSGVISGKPETGAKVRFLATECSKGPLALNAEILSAGGAQ
jgi:cold shock CspA family protein